MRDPAPAAVRLDAHAAQRLDDRRRPHSRLSRMPNTMAEKPTVSAHTAQSAGAFELKTSSFTLPVIRLFDADLEALALRLGAKVEKAPDFFRHTPVVIDLSELVKRQLTIALAPLIGLLRSYGMIPVGVRGGTREHAAAAEALELAVLRDAPTRRNSVASSTPAEPKTPAAPSKPIGPLTVADHPPPQQSDSAFMLITKPVRSGQRIYATGGDLSIIAPVSSGAELMADGNIHIYGTLRGRALAGMSGNLEARIFCHDLQAELISIAGNYRVSEGIPNELRGVPVQIFLDHNILRIEKL